jgi:hypothetical protein
MKTRQFIFGLILLLLCGTATAVHVDVVQIHDHTWDCDAFNVVLFIFTILGAISGAVYIFRSLEES